MIKTPGINSFPGVFKMCLIISLDNRTTLPDAEQNRHNICYYINMPKINIDKLTSCIIDAIQDKKGTDIKVLDLSEIEGASAQTFVIGTGRTPTQVSAIADSIEERVKSDLHDRPENIHGTRNSQWIIMDYGSVMVHIFVPDMRSYYDLEGLWSDAPCELVPELE